MRRRITTILLVILLISGLVVMAYPWISNGLFATTQAHVIRNYEKDVSDMNEKEIEREKEKARVYDEEEIASGVEDPFATAQSENEGSKSETAESEGENVESEVETAETEEEGSYANILNVGDTMGYLEIPRLKETLPIYHGTSELAMQEGAGHMEGTSMPVGGSSTHCVLASHSGLTSAKLFTDLNQMEVGDKFYLYVLDETLTYQVDQINVVLPSDTSKLQIEKGQDYVTLLTCTPTGTNTHRLLVRGRRIPNEKQETSANEVSDKTIIAVIWWVLPLMAAALIIFRMCMQRKK